MWRALRRKQLPEKGPCVSQPGGGDPRADHGPTASRLSAGPNMMDAEKLVRAPPQTSFPALNV